MHNFALINVVWQPIWYVLSLQRCLFQLLANMQSMGLPHPTPTHFIDTIFDKCLRCREKSSKPQYYTSDKDKWALKSFFNAAFFYHSFVWIHWLEVFWDGWIRYKLVVLPASNAHHSFFYISRLCQAHCNIVPLCNAANWWTSWMLVDMHKSLIYKKNLASAVKMSRKKESCLKWKYMILI